MNFSAFEYWTDGWSDGSLMPVGEGVRKCSCGDLFLTRECELVEIAESSEFQRPDFAGPDDFREHISKTSNQKLLLAMRLDLWRHLNHPYRTKYRTHRDNEEANLEAEWARSNPDLRTWWDKLRGRKAPSYQRPSGHPITFPYFDVLQEQLENMQALTELFLQRAAADRDNLLLAELLREQGRFDEAKRVISFVKSDWDETRRKIIWKSIERLEPMPIRFRY